LIVEREPFRVNFNVSAQKVDVNISTEVEAHEVVERDQGQLEKSASICEAVLMSIRQMDARPFC